MPAPSRTEAWTTPTPGADPVGACRPLALGCLDLTGGAPELQPWLRGCARRPRLRRAVIDSCKPDHPAGAGRRSELRSWPPKASRLVASLPCYLKKNVEKQRGGGVFARSIEVLRRLTLWAKRPSLTAASRTGSRVYTTRRGRPLPPPQQDPWRPITRRVAVAGVRGVVFQPALPPCNMPIHPAGFRAALAAKRPARRLPRPAGRRQPPARISIR